MALVPATGLAGDAVVRVQDGRVWATLDKTPTSDAVDAIKRAAGVDVIIPASSVRQTLTLTAEAMPFEQFVRRVLENFDVGGFALVYNAAGTLEQVIVAEKGSDAPHPAHPPLPAAAVTIPRPPPVPFLIRSTEAVSMKLGAPGQVIVVQSQPFAITRTKDCNGEPGDYPVQTVLVTDAGDTYITSIVVCALAGLTAGERLTPGPPPASNSGDQSRFVGSR